jgi:hypothetical protein
VVGGDFDLGTGVSSRFWTRHAFGITPSAGVHARDFAWWETGVTAGLRVDLGVDIEGSSRPLVGMRIDGRYGFGPMGERSIFVGTDLDVFGLGLIAMLPLLMPYGD